MIMVMKSFAPNNKYEGYPIIKRYSIAIEVFVEMIGAKLKKFVINVSMILTRRIYIIC